MKQMLKLGVIGVAVAVLSVGVMACGSESGGGGSKSGSDTNNAVTALCLQMCDTAIKYTGCGAEVSAQVTQTCKEQFCSRAFVDNEDCQIKFQALAQCHPAREVNCTDRALGFPAVDPCKAQEAHFSTGGVCLAGTNGTATAGTATAGTATAGTATAGTATAGTATAGTATGGGTATASDGADGGTGSIPAPTTGSDGQTTGQTTGQTGGQSCSDIPACIQNNCAPGDQGCIAACIAEVPNAESDKYTTWSSCQMSCYNKAGQKQDLNFFNCLGGECADPYHACFVQEVGTYSCNGILQCRSLCSQMSPNDGGACASACESKGSLEGWKKFFGMLLCIQGACPPPPGAQNLDQACVSQALEGACKAATDGCTGPVAAGAGTCSTLLTCSNSCNTSSDPVGCSEDCVVNTSAAEHTKYTAMTECIATACANIQDQQQLQGCIQQAQAQGGACFNQLQTCACPDAAKPVLCPATQPGAAPVCAATAADCGGGQKPGLSTMYYYVMPHMIMQMCMDVPAQVFEQ